MLAPKSAGNLLESLAPGEPSIDVERRLRYPGLAADFSDRGSVLSLLQDKGDLRLRELRCLQGTLLLPVPGS